MGTTSITRKRFITGIAAAAIGAIALKPRQAIADVLTLADVLAMATAQSASSSTPMPTSTRIPRFDDSMLKPTVTTVYTQPTWNWVYPNSDVLTLNQYDAHRIMFSHESLHIEWYADYKLIREFDIPVGVYPRRYFTVPFMPTSSNQYILFSDSTGQVGCWWSK